MKHLSKSLLATSSLALLSLAALAGCDGSAPAKKDVQAKPVDASKQVEPAGAKFKGGDNMQSTDKVGADGKPK